MEYLKAKLVKLLPSSWSKFLGLSPKKKTCCKGKSPCKIKPQK